MGIHNLSTLGETSQLKLESTEKKSNRTSMMMKIIILLPIVAIVLASSAPMQDTIEERSGRECNRNKVPTDNSLLAINCDVCEEYGMNERLSREPNCIYCCCTDTTFDNNYLLHFQTCGIAAPVEYKPAETVYGK